MDTSEQLQAAISAYQKGDFNTTITLCQKILDIEPTHAQALNLLGILNHQNNQSEVAITLFHKAIEANPTFYAAHFNLGSILKARNELDKAIQIYHNIMQLAPDDIESRLALADIYIEQRLYTQALSHMQYAINITPKASNIHSKMAIAFNMMGQTTQADEHALYAQLFDDTIVNNPALTVSACDAFLLKYPRHTHALIHKGVALEKLKQFQYAIDTYNRALSLDPTLVVALYNRGNAQHSLGLYQQALLSYKTAFDMSGDVSSGMNYVFLNLLMGEYATGWKNYDYRFITNSGSNSADRIEDFHQFKDQEWQGEPHQNDVLHIWNEQGIGDEILFSSLFNEASTFFSDVIIETDPRLVDLFSRSFPNVTIIPRHTPREYIFPSEKTVWHLPSGSLGKFFRNSINDFNNKKSYLMADDRKTNEFIKQFKKDNNLPLIGIAWASGGASGAYKTLPMDKLAAVLTRYTSARFICLQYHASSDDITTFEQLTNTNLMIPNFDVYNQLDDLAALINACDYIVTCSNATAHLAGALGKPTFILVPESDGLFWYWGIEKHTTPWYPSIHIIRQTQPGDWDSALVRLDAVLQQYINRH